MFHGKREILAQNDMSVIRNDDDDGSNFWVPRPDMQCTSLPLWGDIAARRKAKLFVFALSWTDSDNVIHCYASLKGSAFLLY